MSEAKIIVKRFDPKTSRFYNKEYKVPYKKDTMVLDALIYIKENIDRDLTFRYSCRMAVCGSCGMVINKRPALACETPVASLSQPIYIEPLYNFPIIKDLVVNIDDFLNKLVKIKPYIIKKSKEPEGEHIVFSEQQELFRYASVCINCLLCYAACPVYGEDEKYFGPAALSLIYRYYMDPRDEGKDERIKVALEKDALWKCTFIGECSEVCPKGVDPAFNIQRLKLIVSMNTLKSLIFPKLK
ncbi:MAG: succinate dehydrogenase/fumarate reductase iron-sulfur subunit [Thermoproteota archaeon]|jgi:fumarate reductase iron-sulfur subunit|nr:succinate dehydrogenase/fumarate reductase iron-sulfur subunit [Thermoproteota archaeon]